MAKRLRASSLRSSAPNDAPICVDRCVVHRVADEVGGRVLFLQDLEVALQLRLQDGHRPGLGVDDAGSRPLKRRGEADYRDERHPPVIVHMC